MTSEMAFIESLLLQKRHFLSSKRGRLFKKYFFSFCNWGTLAQKKGTFFTFKKVGGTCPHCPPPRFRGPCSNVVSNVEIVCQNKPSLFWKELPEKLHYFSFSDKGLSLETQ